MTTISFSSAGQVVGGVQFDLEWDETVDLRLVPGAQIGSSAKTLSTAALGPRNVRCVIIGMNQAVLYDGELIRIFVTLSQPGAARLRLVNLVATGPEGASVFLDGNPATIQVDAGSATQLLSAQEVLNAASLLPGAISPGEIVTLFGSIPSAPDILLDGVLAPVLFADGNQMNAIIPFGLNPAASHNLVVRAQSRQIAAIALPSAEVSPAIFSQNGSGIGPGAILNQDYSLNSASNPAAPGSVIMIYGTGFGVSPSPERQPDSTASTTTLSVTASIGGMPAPVIYAGSARGLIAGVAQVNVAIPAGAQPDLSAPLSLSIGNAVTQPGVTVAIR